MPSESSSTVRIYYPEFSLEGLLELLRERVEALRGKLPVVSAFLFGSCAAGRHTAASDIDLLIVYDGAKREDAYNIAWDTFKLPKLQLHIYTCDEMKMLVESGSQFIKEALEQGIALIKL